MQVHRLSLAVLAIKRVTGTTWKRISPPPSLAASVSVWAVGSCCTARLAARMASMAVMRRSSKEAASARSLSFAANSC